MLKSRKKRKSPRRVLALPDLEQAKSAVIHTLEDQTLTDYSRVSRRVYSVMGVLTRILFS
jgi:hypothetical protein